MRKDETIQSEPVTTGIYMILNTVVGKAYVGQAENIRTRLVFHRARLRKGIHKNPYLQAAFLKYGEQAFKFTVVKECKSIDELLAITEIEQTWINAFKVNNKSYNMLDATGSRLGTKQTDAAKAKVSKAMRGRIITWGDEISEAKRGIPQSPEHIKKLSQIRKGKITHNAASVNVVDKNGNILHFRSENMFSLAIGRSIGYAYAMKQRGHTYQALYDLAVLKGLVK